MTNLIVVRMFFEGGWIMYPILATSLAGLWVILERGIWWIVEARSRDRARVEQVLEFLEKNQVDDAAELAAGGHDPILRVLWFGLSHNEIASLQGAFQLAAGIELERAGRYIVALDTIVTLAPLLGLLGTVTGLMRAFFKLGGSELTEQAIGGGIAEALIATACGLSIAVICLIFLNLYATMVANLQFRLQIACGRAEVLLHYHVPKDHHAEVGSGMPEATDTASLMPPSYASAESMNPPTI